MSASVPPQEGERLLSNGTVAAFLPKPFDMDEMLALVQRLAA